MPRGRVDLAAHGLRFSASPTISGRRHLEASAMGDLDVGHGGALADARCILARGARHAKPYRGILSVIQPARQLNRGARATGIGLHFEFPLVGPRAANGRLDNVPRALHGPWAGKMTCSCGRAGSRRWGLTPTRQSQSPDDADAGSLGTHLACLSVFQLPPTWRSKRRVPGGRCCSCRADWTKDETLPLIPMRPPAHRPHRIPTGSLHSRMAGVPTEGVESPLSATVTAQTRAANSLLL